jgi:rhodanese-related sulfurtransferase
MERQLSLCDCKNGSEKLLINQSTNRQLATKEEISTVKLILTNYLPVVEIPFCELPTELDKLPKEKFIGIFCSSGVRSTIAFAYLKSKGFVHVKMIEGGYTQFMEAVMPGKMYKHIKNRH